MKFQVVVIALLIVASAAWAEEEGTRPVRQQKRVVGFSTRSGMGTMRGKIARFYSSSQGIIAVRQPPSEEARGQLAYPSEDAADDSGAEGHESNAEDSAEGSGKQSQ